jgi:hypothetical protein
MPTPASAAQFGGTSSLAVTTSNITHNITLQAQKLDIAIIARDTDGNLVSGNAFAEYTNALVFEGVGGRAYDAWGASALIGGSGTIELFTFKPSTDPAIWGAVAQEWPEIQTYLSNLDHIGIPDNNRDGHSDGIRVTYLSAPGVEQSIWVPAVEWTTGRAEVVFDAVPEISVSTPASVSANKTSYATASISPSLLTGLRSVATSSNQSKAAVFKGKTVKLYSRTIIGTNKYGKWTYEGSCKLSATGKCKAKFKISKKSQLVFRATDFALPIKTKTVKIKK